MAIKHEVTNEFRIPNEQHQKPIPGDILEIIGGFTSEARSMTPAQLALSLVLLEGYSYSEQTSWDLVARSAHAGDESEPIFGSTNISDDTGAGIKPEQALLAGDEWIRSSKSTLFVLGSVCPLPVPEEMKNSGVAGLILVRTADAI